MELVFYSREPGPRVLALCLQAKHLSGAPRVSWGLSGGGWLTLDMDQEVMLELG